MEAQTAGRRHDDARERARHLAWDSDRDEAFFRIVSCLLQSAVVAGASSLLVSYDAGPAGSPHVAPARAVPPRLPLQVTVRGSRP